MGCRPHAGARDLGHGGRWSDLSQQDVDLIDRRIRSGGNTVLAGRNTGREMSWGFRDDWLFGFDYDETEMFPVRIVSRTGFGTSVRVATDIGHVSGGQALYVVDEENPGRPRPNLGVVATRHWAWGARTVWIGFDLDDVWSSFDQRRILRDISWYVDVDPVAAVAELAAVDLDPSRRAFLLEILEEDLIRPGTSAATREVLERATGEVRHRLRRARLLGLTRETMDRRTR